MENPTLRTRHMFGLVVTLLHKEILLPNEHIFIKLSIDNFLLVQFSIVQLFFLLTQRILDWLRKPKVANASSFSSVFNSFISKSYRLNFFHQGLRGQFFQYKTILDKHLLQDFTCFFTLRGQNWQEVQLAKVFLYSQSKFPEEFLAGVPEIKSDLINLQLQKLIESSSGPGSQKILPMNWTKVHGFTPVT